MNQPNVPARPGPTIEQFESLDIDPAEFDHEAHLYLAWSYLKQFDLLASIDRYRLTLRRLTQKFGVPGKYHETITWFYLIQVSERSAGDAESDWLRFKEENRDLFARNPGIIRRYYSESRLMCDVASEIFVLPDLSPPR